jgi:hypothetical protein
MLLLTVSLIWLAIGTFVVLLCRAAADGDAALLAGAKRASAGASHGAGSGSGRTHTTWRRSTARSAARAGDGARPLVARESELLTRRGGE